jgi:hypothetical protein
LQEKVLFFAIFLLTNAESYANIVLQFEKIEPKLNKRRYTMNFDRSKLIGRIAEKFGTRKALAEQIGWTESRLSLRLTNTVQFNEEEIRTLVIALDIPAEEISAYFFAL